MRLVMAVVFLARAAMTSHWGWGCGIEDEPSARP